MKYTRDLISEFNTEAKKRGISVDQLPSGEQHIYRQEMEGLLDQDLSIQTKVYFDQMEQRGFRGDDAHKRATDSILKGLGVSTPLSPKQEISKDNIEHEKRYGGTKLCSAEQTKED